MDLYEISDQVVALLRQRGRLAYRALKLQFQLDEEQLEALSAYPNNSCLVDYRV